MEKVSPSTVEHWAWQRAGGVSGTVISRNLKTTGGSASEMVELFRAALEAHEFLADACLRTEDGRAPAKLLRRGCWRGILDSS